MIAATTLIVLLLGSLKGGEHVDNPILFAAGAYGELYVALGARSPWGTLFGALVLAFLSSAAARMAEAATVSPIASGSQHSTMMVISHRIARSLSVSVPISSASSGSVPLGLGPVDRS